MSGSAATHTAVEKSYAPSRAARELELKRGELDLAVQLGYVRTVPAEDSGRRRVERSELERLRAVEGFPEALRERVRVVGTGEGAALMGITKDRFTKLARVGFLIPVRWYLNRYRSVVWLYLADDARQFAESNPAMLTGRTPERMRSELNAGEDQRARNWRGRYCGHLLRLAEGEWQRAAVSAAMLDPAQVVELVPDPYERAYLHRLRPESSYLPGGPESPAATVAASLIVADDPDEIRWLRASLALDLEAARQDHPAPRPRESASQPPSPAASRPIPSPTGAADLGPVAPGNDATRPRSPGPPLHPIPKRHERHERHERQERQEAPPGRTLLAWLLGRRRAWV